MLRVLILCVLLIAVFAQQTPRGVDSNDSEKYNEHHSKNKFVCLDNLKTIDYSQVNDDYCDCADGSDEPGTSACAKAGRVPTMFYCQNKGFVSKRIFSSFVNDGICDCCDGSDENDGTTKCPNTCEEFGASIKLSLEKQIKDLTNGLLIKEKYIKNANSELEAKTVAIASKKEQLSALQKELDIIAEDKEAKEKIETEQRDELRAAKKAEWEQNVANTQAQAETAQQAGEPAEVPAEVPAEASTTEEQPADSEVTTATTTPEPPQYVEEEEVKNFKTEEAEKARNLENSKRVELEALKRDIEELEKVANADHGPENEFYEIRGKTVSVQDKQYTYQNQVLVDMAQKDQHSHTSLGSFTKFNENYTEMHYTGGQTCWQGPARSTVITLECSGDDSLELYKVDEPSRCVYTMILKTPSACKTSNLEVLEKQLKQFQ
ncbi:protein kinase C substrate 80K-H [Acrasis kona]|uniref:Glucosidase 2 subunit beta n=1 Tax=Acrasis kona TaxID=1008807 RepID=A0AAW2YT34_9EUKA